MLNLLFLMLFDIVNVELWAPSQWLEMNPQS